MKQKTEKYNNKNINDIRIAYDVNGGIILGMIRINAHIERVFQSLISEDIIYWWVRPGVFDTTSWEGEVKIGGEWKSKGTARGQPYMLRGRYLEINEPYKLIHTYGEGMSWGPTTVSYQLESEGPSTFLVLRHEGFTSPVACEGNGLGWETCFEALKEKLEQKISNLT